MIQIVVRYLGGLRMDRGLPEEQLVLPDGSSLLDLKAALLARGLDADNNENIYVLDGYGFAQFPPDQQLTSGQVVAIFPHIAGGAGAMVFVAGSAQEI